ncbi:MAG TPA: TldD/PmbA family protein [Thermoanaerobaculia bacterium]|nr:TldD/PmbA family protein [Thermoanaerobaculia bacterium]
MSLTAAEAREIIDRILKIAKADATSVSIEGSRKANLRFARNEITTSGDVSDTTVNVRSSFGKKSGSATANQFDDASLERAVRRSEETARFAPEDPEHMPLLGPQKYIAATGAFDEATANLAPDVRANLAAKSIAMANEKKLEIAGFFTNSAEQGAIGNSKGLFGFHRSTRVTFSSTARTPDGTGSGWAGGNAERIGSIDPLRLAEAAVGKATLSRNPKELAPGTYPVILEPAAVADLLMYLTFAADARAADEGRSFFAKAGGGTKIGEKVVSERVTIRTDPADPRAPGSPFSGEGLPTKAMPIIEKGVLRNLFYSRFWAEKMKTEPTAFPTNLIMEGGSGTLEDLIGGAPNAVLVTRLWYIRFLDPQTVLLTGLTRDGTYQIEKGRVRHAVKNFRWNDSPVAVLSKIEAMSAPVRARGSEAENFSIVCPAIRSTMTFSSLSDAV